VAGSAFAQEPSREREAVRRAQQQIAKLQQENVGLQHQKDELDGKLKAAQAELAKLKGESGKQRRTASALATAQKDAEDLRTRLASTETRLKEAAEKCQEQIGMLRRERDETQRSLAETKAQAAGEVAALRTSLTSQTARADVCEDKNRKLYSVTVDLIDKYKQNRGAWEKFLLAEPFTGLKAVEVQNLLDDLRQHADASKITGQPATSGSVRSENK
jgi:chromosome segregation ATPase